MVCDNIDLRDKVNYRVKKVVEREPVGPNSGSWNVFHSFPTETSTRGICENINNKHLFSSYSSMNVFFR